MTEKPGKQPTDHEKPAAQREAEKSTGDTITIHGAGMDFTIPASMEDLDGEFLRYAADQDSYRMTQVVLSDEQFATFRKSKPKIRDYNALGEEIARAYGFNSVGE